MSRFGLQQKTFETRRKRRKKLSRECTRTDANERSRESDYFKSVAFSAIASKAFPKPRAAARGPYRLEYRAGASCEPKLGSARSLVATHALCPFTPKTGVNGAANARARQTLRGMTNHLNRWGSLRIGIQDRNLVEISQEERSRLQRAWTILQTLFILRSSVPPRFKGCSPSLMR